MQNIEKLVQELVDWQVISGSVGDHLINFIRRNGGLKDIEEKDIYDIVAKISSLEFGTGLNLSDKELSPEHRRKTTLLMGQACMCQNMASTDVSKMFAIYIEIYKANKPRQT